MGLVSESKLGSLLADMTSAQLEIWLNSDTIPMSGKVWHRNRKHTQDGPTPQPPPSASLQIKRCVSMISCCLLR